MNNAILSSSGHSRSIRSRASVRGELPTRKLHYSDNFELVAMRHREFRRSPDPAPDQLRRLKPVAESASRKFLFMNRPLCLLHGYEEGDLVTYALVWTTNFLGLHAKDERQAKPDENAKLLYSYLRQRFNELRALLIKKGRSCFPEVSVGIFLPNCVVSAGSSAARVGRIVHESTPLNLDGFLT